MRQVLLSLVAIAALAGCGTAATPVAGAASTAALRARAATAEKPFVLVLAAETTRWEQARRAGVKYIADFKPEVPTGPDGKLELATAFVPQEMFWRETRVGVELIGTAAITGAKPATVERPAITRGFRMHLNAGGKLQALDWETPAIDHEPLLRPAYKPLSAATAKRFQADLKAFLNAPEQAELREQPLWAALAGTNGTNQVKLTGLAGTAGNFGAFGKVYRFEATLTHDGQVILDKQPVTAARDKAGTLIAAN